MNLPIPDLPNFPYTRTFRFSMETVARLSHLAVTLRKDQSTIIRDAIDEYFERHADPQEFTTQAEEPANAAD